MRFLKTLIWVTVMIGLIVFATNNWFPVSVRLWGGMWLDTKLPALVIAAFLLGFLPLYFLHRTILWRMKRRVLTLEGSQRPIVQTASAPPRPAYQPGDPA